MVYIVNDDTTANVPAIYQLLNIAKQKVGAVGKSERNTAQNFSFRGIDTVVNAVAPVFNELGIINVPEVIEHLYDTVEIGAKRTPMGHVTMVVKYSFFAPDGSHVDAQVASEAMDSGDKAVAKAMSVAWRIALLQVLNLPTDEPDPDSVSYERSGFQTTAPVGHPVQPVRLDAPQDLVNDIVSAASLDDVRAAWKIAGAQGHLPSIAVLGTGEKISVQELLYKRKDELEKAGKAEIG
jgi:ERF superfamily